MKKREFSLVLDDIDYFCEIDARKDELTISLAEMSSGFSWQRIFLPDYIEKLTQQAGSPKTFEIFCEFVLKCLECHNEKEEFSVNLLTDEQIRELSGKKTKPANTNKRNLVLTYKPQFYKPVFYPLSLPLVNKEGFDDSLVIFHNESKEECSETEESESFGELTEISSAKYKQILSDHKQLVLQLRAYEQETIPQFENEMKDLKKIIDTKDEENEKLRDSKSQRKIRELQIAVEEYEDQIINLRKQHRKEINEFKRERRELEDENEQLKKRVTRLRQNIRNASPALRRSASFRRTASKSPNTFRSRSKTKKTKTSSRMPKLASRSRSPPIRARSESYGRSRSTSKKRKRFDPTDWVNERKKKIHAANRRRKRSESPALRGRKSRSTSRNRSVPNLPSSRASRSASRIRKRKNLSGLPPKPFRRKKKASEDKENKPISKQKKSKEAYKKRDFLPNFWRKFLGERFVFKLRKLFRRVEEFFGREFPENGTYRNGKVQHCEECEERRFPTERASKDSQTCEAKREQHMNVFGIFQTGEL